MKVTDYIVECLIKNNVKDIFGYPGGVICHFIDSASKYSELIQTHATYHEQAAAFAACSYAQATKNIGVAYSTSGPGATNLVTGVANAYYDSIPVIFITGQVDTYMLKGDRPIRQRGFQETDIVELMKGITKYAVRITDAEKIRYYFEKSVWIAKNGKPGPVVIDIPADVQRADVDPKKIKGYNPNEKKENVEHLAQIIVKELYKAKRPCILVGNGVRQANMKDIAKKLIEKWKIPTVFSMPAVDFLAYDHPFNFGFIGANGKRYANFILAKCDLLISIGARMDNKQVGKTRENFAPNACFIRIDIDDAELSYKVRDDEIQIIADVKKILPKLLQYERKNNDKSWINVCNKIKTELLRIDKAKYHYLIEKISLSVPRDVSITIDVGQSGVWVSQSFQFKDGQNLYMSAGLGSMGYSLPAAIGIYYATKKPVFCFNGDGGIQMNIQELQFVKREGIPIKIIVLNNHSLGMIRGFQEKNFEENYIDTIDNHGYLSPDFKKIAYAFDLRYTLVEDEIDIMKIEFNSNLPELVEIKLSQKTVLDPNFGSTCCMQDQQPYLKRELYNKIMNL